MTFRKPINGSSVKTQPNKLDRSPTVGAQNLPDSKAYPYAGFYRSSGSKYVRESDGLVLQLCRSRRPGGADQYVFDATNRKHLNSLWVDHEYPRFDDRTYKYQIRPVEGGAEIEGLYRMRKRFNSATEVL